MNVRLFIVALFATTLLVADDFIAETNAIGTSYVQSVLPGRSLFEPSLAKNPKNPQEMALCWQKDVPSSYTIASTTDGGKTWQEVEAPCGSQVASDFWIRFSSDGKLKLMATAGSRSVVVGESADAGKSWKVVKKLSKEQDEQTQESVLVLPLASDDHLIWQNDSWEDKEKRFSGKEVAFRLENGKLFVNDQFVAECEIAEYNINPVNGFLYIVYTSHSDHNIQLISSRDGGATWTAPFPANRAAHAKAFAPFVAITADGSVGVLYYDLRNDLADCWLAIYQEVPGGLRYVEEHRLTKESGPVPVTCPGGMYVRDYPFLDSYKDGFFALFTIPEQPTFLSLINKSEK